MPFQCKVVMQFKEGKLCEVMDLRKDPKEGLAKTKAWPGYENIELYTDKANKDTLVCWETWATEASFDSYFAMRQESGFFDKIGPLLAAPPQKMKLNPFKL